MGQSNRSAHTYKLRKYYVDLFLSFCGPGMVSSLTRHKLTQFHQWVKTSFARGQNGGNHALREVRTMLRWAEEEEICTIPVRRFPKLQAEAGTNIVSLAQLMGHTSTETTARYITATAEHHRQVVDRTAEHILAIMWRSGEAAKGLGKNGQKMAGKDSSGLAPDGGAVVSAVSATC